MVTPVIKQLISHDGHLLGLDEDGELWVVTIWKDQYGKYKVTYSPVK